MNIAAQAARNLGGFVPNKIFIGGVPITCSEDEFRKYFEPYGNIAKVELHALRGFGYITYESVDAVDACLEKYEEHYLCKKWVEVKRSIPRELIDAYEREQRRLTAEYSAAENGEKPGDPTTRPEQPTAPTAPTVSVNSVGSRGSAWGSGRGVPPPATREGPGVGIGNLSRITQLRDMGFSESVAKRALSECAWDVNAAIDKLLASGTMPGEEEATESDAGAAAGADAAAATAAPANGSAAALPPTASVHIEPTEAHAEDPATPAPTIPEVAGSEEAQPESTPAQAAAEATTGTPEVVEAAPEVVESAAEAVKPETAVEPSAPETAVIETTNGDSHSAVPAKANEQNAESGLARMGNGESFVKVIERIGKPLNGQFDTQLPVYADEFVKIWRGTETENGWVHAEKIQDSSQAGWLPTCSLSTLQTGHRWMQTIQAWEAMDSSQCPLQVGTIVTVWVTSRTPEGWTYVEGEKDGEKVQGWAPVFCLEWPTDL